MLKNIFAFCLLLVSLPGECKEIRTNAAHIKDAPEWLTGSRIDHLVDHMQHVLEWNIRRVEVYWYTDQAGFEASHGLGRTVLAISKKSDNSVHIGPRVNNNNFDGIFGHEMVHIITFQKYKEAIPRWLDEGLANYLSKQTSVDYKWLNTQPPTEDIHDLVHPFSGTEDHIRYCYMASQALTEMIAAKCDLENLLRLSVGKKMESYLDTYCGFKNLTADFNKWVKSHGA